MKIFVFGNPLISKDSVALKVLPELRAEFPEIEFIEFDTAELLEEFGDDLIILDSVVGIQKVQMFNGIDSFVESPRYSLHDFDLPIYLKLLNKLGKLKKVRIIGVPSDWELDTGNRTNRTSQRSVAHGTNTSFHRELLSELVVLIREIKISEQSK
jgi:Ni,Fe-hydrogenase maturation factor